VARTVQVDAWDSDIADVRLELSELRAQVNELSALVGGASADEAADVARDDDL
jgi:hypothetical protein